MIAAQNPYCLSPFSWPYASHNHTVSSNSTIGSELSPNPVSNFHGPPRRPSPNYTLPTIPANILVSQTIISPSPPAFSIPYPSVFSLTTTKPPTSASSAKLLKYSFARFPLPTLTIWNVTAVILNQPPFHLFPSFENSQGDGLYHLSALPAKTTNVWSPKSPPSTYPHLPLSALHL